MQREKALELLKENLKNQNLQKHCLAVEVAMKKLAEHFGKKQCLEARPLNIGKWALCGLLHDIDYEKTANNPNLHSKQGSAMLKDLGLDQEICQAVLTHNEAHGITPEGLMAKALFCIDPLTGLIVAGVLVLPSKKLAGLKTESVLKRFKEKSFARGVNREIIAKCQEYLNLTLEKFVEIVLSSMRQISDELGL